jgi:hypothetical protein
MKSLKRAAGALLLATPAAWAHEGHGLPGASHWHASYLWGLGLALGIAAVAYWLSRGGK